jgi:hypothetical protein
MPFNPIAKSVKDIQEAYQNGEIDRDAVLAIYQERLNRPGKSQVWKTRYENAISALIKNDDLANGPSADRNSGTITNPVNPEVSVQTRDPSSFRLGEIHESILLESFERAGRISVRAAELFPTDWRVSFPKAMREENPIGTQFRAEITVSASTTDPDTLFLKARSKTITIVSSGPAQPKEPQTPQPIRPIPQETPEIGKSGSIRKPSNLLKKLPSVFSPEKKETFVVKGLEDAETNNQKFICGLRGLVGEIRRSNKGKKTLNLTNGVRQPSLSGEFANLYAFKFDSDEEFFEGARIDIQVGSRKIKGSIASIFGDQIRTLVIAMDEDCGGTVDHCSIVQDDATFFESLQNRLEIEEGKGDRNRGKPVGMNLALADDLLKGKSNQLKTSAKAKLDYSELNEGQIDFTKKMVKNSISFLWGPPGTGKTQTLGAGLTYFYDNEERSLITSNTNKAVDQVLLKLCKRLQNEGKISDLEDGKIVRIGRISHEELEKDFSAYVTVDGIATRRGSKMQKKINSLEKERTPLELGLKELQPLYDRFRELEKNKASLTKNTAELDNIKAEILEKETLIKNLKEKVSNLEKEKKEHANKGFFGKAFGKSIEVIEKDLSGSSRNLEKEETNQAKLKIKSDSIDDTLKNIKFKVENQKSELEGKNFTKLMKDIEGLEKSIDGINAEVAKLNKEMEELRKTILSDALIVGATLTKTFLSPSDLGKFENVIVDEASMALLPAVYFVASQSQRRCIISGDFRQIPAIVQSKNKTILDILGDDIFKYSGMEEDFEDNNEGSNAGVLTQQYRMDPKICSLISNIGYSGRLTTAKERKVELLESPEMFDDSIIIIDTSSIYPFCDKDPFNSKSNMTHALIARNIMRGFAAVPNSGNIGFCAPFKAQIKLMKKISEKEAYKENVSIGTIHTFQGDEKATVIFDSVESLGEDWNIFIPHGQQSPSKSSTLTVAVSRAQQKLIFIANLRYLDTKIPAQGYFRHILYKAQETGSVIDAQKIINLETLETELSVNMDDFVDLGIDVSNLSTGLADQDLFFPLLRKDIENASKFIVIYSGFYTGNRISDLLDNLKPKIKNNVKVKVIVPPPEENGSMDVSDSQQVIEKLEALGIVVEFRAKIHQKAVLIDENIVWFGSLNPLSYRSTLETMIRFDHEGLSAVFAETMATNKKSMKKGMSFIAEPENPVCKDEACQSKTIFIRGRYGPYYKCSKCSNTHNLQ